MPYYFAALFLWFLSTKLSFFIIFKMPYYTYILKSESTGNFYIGQTNNLEDRIRRHNQGYSKYTKNKGPWVLFYSREFSTRSEAVRCELLLKGLKNKNLILDWIRSNSR